MSIPRQSIRSFFRSEIEQRTTASAIAGNRVLKISLPLAVGVMLLTVSNDPLSVLGTGIVAIVLSAEWLRLKGYCPVLNLRISQLIGVSAIGLALGLLYVSFHPLVLAVLFPVTVVLIVIYFRHEFVRWSTRTHTSGGKNNG